MIEVRVPTSKSLTQRALVLAAISPGRSTIVDPLDCDDSRVLRRALGAMGVTVAETQRDGITVWLVDGVERLRAPAERPGYPPAAMTTQRVARGSHASSSPPRDLPGQRVLPAPAAHDRNSHH